MNRHLWLAGIVLLAGLLPGCFIQSIHPFYTDELMIELPAIQGEWFLVKKGKEDAADDYPQPWLFADGEIITFEDDVSSALKATYFKIGGVTYVDLAPVEPAPREKPNSWWTIHTVPVHSVCKVELAGKTLGLTPLNGEWVTKLLAAKEVVLAHVAVDDEGDHIVLTGPAAELVRFLKQHGAEPDAFPADTMFHFQRKPAKAKRQE